MRAVAARHPLALRPAVAACARSGRLRDDAAEDDPLQVRLDDMDRRLGRVERVAGNQSLARDVAAHRRAAGRSAPAARPGRGAARTAARRAQAAARPVRRPVDGGWRRSRAAVAAWAAARRGRGRGALGGDGRRRRRDRRGCGAAGGARRAVRSAEQRYGRAFDALKAGELSGGDRGHARFPRRPTRITSSPTTRSTGWARPTT